MSVFPTRLNNICCVMAVTGLVVLPAVADSGHQHGHAAASESGDNATPWQLDVMMGYQNMSSPVIAGFLPYDTHYLSAGVSLQHVDIGRSFQLPDQHLYGRAVLSYHSSSTEVHEAWLGHQAGNWEMRAGQQLVDIGWLNRLHGHSRRFAELPLVYQALWGGEWSEGEARLAYQGQWSEHWQWRTTASVLGTSQMATTDDGSAAMITAQVGTRYGQWQHLFKLDVYGAEVGQRGMQLFATSSESHTHGSTATEYFDGQVSHIALGWSGEWKNTLGVWQLQGEYQQRQEEGDLSSADGQTTDASAALDLRSWGAYLDLSWQQRTLEAGLRWQMIGSDVALSELSSDDLEDSILNHEDRSPSYLNMLVAWHLPLPGSKLRLQYNVPLADALALPRTQLQWVHSVAF
ncbi:MULTISPECIES: hypothetical protein [unclassified Oceanobacter]|uniref:hypothetical protein n=1 Tax=unclassified Oceanobacter TaxID=2620260 RepID=UPI002735EFF6|nr:MULTISPECIES: hypothetical protein [unclassified Oceanobacter]MDP2609840.1 hypothetical protein [Oceanobacter sp. 1_MG-2023]MDP2612282.1 hypothetical protein [Oceanobacter sp. 2_MG-2023]